MKNRPYFSKSLLAMALGAQLSVPAQADLLPRKFCIWDPIGANGPIFNMMKTSKTAAIKWGVNFDLQAYTDEKIAVDDFKAGQCDAVLLTGTRAREFNPFTGSLEALGAIPSDKDMRVVLETISQPKASKLMTHGKYEVAGLVPGGSVYLFVRDKGINSVDKLQGKKIATFDYDNAAIHMVRHIGASVVGASSSSFAGKFNNGSVDIAYAPAIAYTPLELKKGVADNGGVIDLVLAQLTFQIIINKEQFPDSFGQEMRGYTVGKFDAAYEIVKNAEAEIDQGMWVRPKQEEKKGYANMFREVRVSLRDDGVYDSKALTLFRKVRCKGNPTNVECVEKTE